MKDIRILNICLENFKGVCGRKEYSFEDYQVVHGANGSGKTTIADAFTWCLFGKNQAGQQAEGKGGFALKTIDTDGKVIPQLEHSVTVRLAITNSGNINTVNLRRTLKEEWIKKRGTATAEFKGHTVDYYINDVPVKASDYSKAVSEICDETQFQLLTRPTWFFAIPWKEQRELIVKLVEFPTLDSISAKYSTENYNISEFIRKIEGRNIEEYKSSLREKIKKLKKELEQFPVKIAGIRSVMPTAAVDDCTILQQKIDMVTKQIDGLKASGTQEKASLNNRINEIGKELDSLFKLKADKIANIELTHKQELQNYFLTLAAEEVEAKNKYIAIKTEIDSKTAQLSSLKFNAESLNKLVTHLTSAVASKRDEWMSENAKQFAKISPDGNSIICPYDNSLCSRPASSVNALLAEKEAFVNSKKAKLQTIQEEGVELKNKLDKTTADVGKILADIETLSKEIEVRKEYYNQSYADCENKERLADAKRQEKEKEINSLILHKKLEVEQEMADTISSKQNELQSLKDKLAITDFCNDDKEIQLQKYTAELHDLQEMVNDLKQISICESEIEELREQEQECAFTIAELESDEIIAEYITRSQINELEKRVNLLFKDEFQVKLFEQQINGGEVETCIITKGGIRYTDLNSASKIKIGLALINQFCRFLQVQVPIFIDNAETITDKPKLNAQMIYLQVDGESKTIEFKNF